MSIRTRLAIAVGLVLVVTLTSLGVVLVTSTRAALVDQVDERVVDLATRSKNQKLPRGGDRFDDAGSEGLAGTGAATGDLYERTVARFIYSRTGRELVSEPCGYADDPKPPPRLPPIPSVRINRLVDRIVTVPAVDDSFSYRMLVQRGDNGTYIVTASPLTAANEAVARLIRVLLLVGAIALGAATLASWWLIRRGMRPVDRMVDTAAAIAAGDLSRRVPDADARTELGRLGGALNEMLVQIERSVQERAANEERLRRFVADAAHELRTPLTSVRGYAELHRQGAFREPAQVDHAMERIEAEGSRMARLVDDLLLLARLDRQRGLEREPVEMAGVLREAIADFTAAAPDRPLTERIEGDAVVLGDRVRLRQVIDNLLANARIHTPPGTPVHLSARRTGTSLEIAVKDDGPGIAPADQERVFERFWRADPSRVRQTGGTGLGLAIVASLVEAHGGTVGVASEPGKGASFTVRLPLAEPPRDAAPAPASTPPREKQPRPGPALPVPPA